jgi:hypothetical protein
MRLRLWRASSPRSLAISRARRASVARHRLADPPGQVDVGRCDLEAVGQCPDRHDSVQGVLGLLDLLLVTGERADLVPVLEREGPGEADNAGWIAFVRSLEAGQDVRLASIGKRIHWQRPL